MTIARKGNYEEWLTEDGLLRVEGWARDGLTDEQIAEKIGITPSTFYAWCKRFSEFSESVKKGKAPVDIEVENALLKSALGYTVKLRKPIKVRKKQQLKDKGMIEEEHIEYAEEEVHIPANVTAQIYWLNNRRPNKWRNKPVEPVTIGGDTAKADDALTAALREEAARLDAGDVEDGVE